MLSADKFVFYFDTVNHIYQTLTSTIAIRAHDIIILFMDATITVLQTF